MKRFLLPLIATLALPHVVIANIDPKVREACLPAADFEGCVRSYTKPKSNENKNDFLGRPVIPGWRKYEDISKNLVIYSDSQNVRKVKVRNTYGRYIAIQHVGRWYQEPVAGKSATSIPIGSANTYCSGVDTGYGSSIGCNTYAAPTIDLPGRQPIQGGVRQKRFISVIDCKEGRYKDYGMNKKKKEWVKTKGFLAETAYLNCLKVFTLEPAMFSKLEKGKPNKNDREYINKLKEKLSKERVGVGIRVVTLKNKEHMIADTYRGHSSSKIVKSRDIILSINGNNIKGLSNEEAREFIIGNIVGSLVNLKIRRGEEIIDVQLKRERYKPEDII